MGRRMQELPKDSKISQRAAHAFHRKVCQELGLSTQAQVAELVRESVQGYSDCLNGHRGSLDRVYAWVERLRAQGWNFEMQILNGEVEFTLHIQF